MIFMPLFQCGVVLIVVFKNKDQEMCEMCHQQRREVQEQEHKKGPDARYDVEGSDIPELPDLPQKQENEISICISNKQWESRAQAIQPYEGGGFEKVLKDDGNPHHWTYKQFRAFKESDKSNQLIKVSIGGDAEFYAYRTPPSDKSNLTFYFVCYKPNSLHKSPYFVFPPSEDDIQKKISDGGNFWGWKVEYEFYALSEVATRLPKSDRKEKEKSGPPRNPNFPSYSIGSLATSAALLRSSMSTTTSSENQTVNVKGKNQ